MTLMKWRNKYVLYSASGKVMLITTSKNIAERMMQ